MRNRLDTDEADEGFGAASLTSISVRKSAKSGLTLDRPAKSGDITERLAALSAELDQEPAPLNGERPAAPVQPDAPATIVPASRPQAPSATAPTPAPALAPTPVRPLRPAPRPRNTGWGQPRPKPAPAPDILTYWMNLRQGKRYPTWEALNAEDIGRNWPNCILVHCNHEAGRLQVKYNFSHAIRKAAYGDIPAENIIADVDFTPMVVDWVLGFARDVSQSGKPAHGTDHFPTSRGEAPLRVIALPLSDDSRSIDHVLCYIQNLTP
ncbi:hypothetical protein [Sneathiella chinensis]|uniref:Uncharacterized protein n=1 Tax=Sneathiella chinensis TaxID=349750 RepID=A0ABQ5U6L5_9PROT|nr:hypothetical protein [Sneathiella chinensis]GLQ07426.1 hypothetical protein GCM10007924_26470 [Sneathiella chinensis]